MKGSKIYLWQVPLIAMFLYASCAVPKQAALPPEKQMPEAFPGAVADNVSIAAITPDKFFPDPHLRALTALVLQHNPDMQIALQRIKTAGAYLSMSRGALLPSLGAAVSAGGTRFGKYTIDGVGNFDTNLSPNIDENQKTPVSPTPDMWLGLRTSWEIDLWGRLRNMKKAARLRFLATQQGKNLVAATLVAQTTLLYYDLVALDKEAGIIRENIELQEKALEVVEAQKAGGRATELAVQQFKAQLLNTRAAAHRVGQQINAAENQLNALAGRYAGTIGRGSELISASFPRIIETGVPAQLLLHRPDLQQVQSELMASKADVAAARAAFFPALNISAYTAFHSFNPGLWLGAASLGYQFLGGLTAPIFQRNQIRGHFNIATAAQETVFFEYQKTALNAYREVITLLQEIDAGREIRQLKQQEVTALEQGVLAANDLYVTGYASYLEIVAAQKSQLEAQLQLVNTERNMMISLITLYQSLGGGWQGN